VKPRVVKEEWLKDNLMAMKKYREMAKKSETLQEQTSIVFDRFATLDEKVEKKSHNEHLILNWKSQVIIDGNKKIMPSFSSNFNNIIF
jgi:hypothetical protein